MLAGALTPEHVLKTLGDRDTFKRATLLQLLPGCFPVKQIDAALATLVKSKHVKRVNGTTFKVVHRTHDTPARSNGV